MTREILTENLGLTDKEAAVYISILELGSSTIQPIAAHSGVKRTSIYYFINHLVDLGLVEAAKIRGRLHYKALPPARLVTLQQNRLEEIKSALPQFESIFNVSTNKPKISYFEGQEQMQQIVLEEHRCKKECLWIWPNKEAIDVVGGTDFMEKLIVKSRASKVFFRLIHFPDKLVPFKDDKGNDEGFREIRYAKPGTTFPLAIGIFDTGKVGFLTSRKEGFGIMIESVEFEAAMRFLFELFWEQASAQL